MCSSDLLVQHETGIVDMFKDVQADDAVEAVVFERQGFSWRHDMGGLVLLVYIDRDQIDFPRQKRHIGGFSPAAEIQNPPLKAFRF